MDNYLDLFREMISFAALPPTTLKKLLHLYPCYLDYLSSVLRKLPGGCFLDEFVFISAG